MCGFDSYAKLKDGDDGYDKAQKLSTMLGKLMTEHKQQAHIYNQTFDECLMNVISVLAYVNCIDNLLSLLDILCCRSLPPRRPSTKSLPI